MEIAPRLVRLPMEKRFHALRAAGHLDAQPISCGAATPTISLLVSAMRSSPVPPATIFAICEFFLRAKWYNGILKLSLEKSDLREKLYSRLSAPSTISSDSPLNVETAFLAHAEFAVSVRWSSRGSIASGSPRRARAQDGYRKSQIEVKGSPSGRKSDDLGDALCCSCSRPGKGD